MNAPLNDIANLFCVHVLFFHKNGAQIVNSPSRGQVVSTQATYAWINLRNFQGTIPIVSFVANLQQ